MTGSLKDPATQVLWDYGEDTPKSLKKLTKALRRRYGGETQVDKYKMELKARRRKKGETLEELHTDIRRLAVLTFPKMGQADREGISCDYFIDALADLDLILQVRQQNPKTLDEALRVAQRLEIWAKNTDHLRNEEKRSREDKRVREVMKADKPDQKTESLAKAHEALKREMAEYKKQTEEYKKQMEKQMDEMRQAMTKVNVGGPSPSPRLEPSSSEDTQQRSPGSFACFGCSSTEHALRECPAKTAEEKRQIWNHYGRPTQRRVRPLNETKTHTCVWVKYKKRRISALLDTGSDITVVGTDVVKKLRWKVHPTHVPSVRTANGELVLTGVIKEDLTVGGRSVASEIFVSPDLTGMIIGLDWLRSQGEFVWDFVNDRIKFPDGRRIGLHEERRDAV